MIKRIKLKKKKANKHKSNKDILDMLYQSSIGEYISDILPKNPTKAQYYTAKRKIDRNARLFKSLKTISEHSDNALAFIPRDIYTKKQNTLIKRYIDKIKRVSTNFKPVKTKLNKNNAIKNAAPPARTIHEAIRNETDKLYLRLDDAGFFDLEKTRKANKLGSKFEDTLKKSKHRQTSKNKPEKDDKSNKKTHRKGTKTYETKAELTAEKERIKMLRGLANNIPSYDKPKSTEGMNRVIEYNPTVKAIQYRINFIMAMQNEGFNQDVVSYMLKHMEYISLLYKNGYDITYIYDELEMGDRESRMLNSLYFCVSSQEDKTAILKLLKTVNNMAAE